MLIGIDVGTTAVKAALFDGKGHVLKSYGERYPTSRPQLGHVEQSPNDWMTRALAALSQFEHERRCSHRPVFAGQHPCVC